MAEMDDEAFARMLQQQLLDEERMLMEQQQQQQQQQQHVPPPQSMPHQGGGGMDPYYNNNNNQDYRNQQHYDDYPRQPYDSHQQHPNQYTSNEREQFDSQAYARHLRSQGFHKEENSQQYGNDHRAQGYGGGGPTGSIQAIPEDDPDLALALRMHEMEVMGMGNQPQDAYTRGTDNRTRYEQEEEDARIARLMAQSGASLRELDFPQKQQQQQRNPGSRGGDFSNNGGGAVPSRFPNSHQLGGSNPMSNEFRTNDNSYPEQPMVPPPMPQYSDHARGGSTEQRNNQGRIPLPQAANSQSRQSSRGQASPSDLRINNRSMEASREFDVQSFASPDPRAQEGSGAGGYTPSIHPSYNGQDTMNNREPYAPKIPPNYSGQRGGAEDPAFTPQRKPPSSNSRDVQAQRSPPRNQLPRDHPGPTGRKPMPTVPAMSNPPPQMMQPTPNQVAIPPGRQSRSRQTGSPMRDRPGGGQMDIMPSMPGDAFLDVPPDQKKKDKKKKRGLVGRMFGGRNGEKEAESASKAAPAPAKPSGAGGIFSRGGRGSGGRSDSNDEIGSADDFRAAGPKSAADEDDVVVRFPIPEPVPRPADTIGAPKGPLPYSLSVSKDAPELPEATIGRRPQLLSRGATCAACGRPGNNLLNALDKKYHADCFRCITCHDVIDSTGAFAFIDNGGEKQPMHRKCYAEIFGVKCCVCKQSIPAGPDGKVSFVKHPFFDTEQMCPRHARNLTRRCTGCHRFEPENEPFADLNDVGRCVCFSCCRSVIVDSQDAQPLWAKVVEFFDAKLNMPIWKDFREVPILVVGYNALNDQMNNTSNVHGGASQIMTRGLCLTEHESGRRFRMNRMKFDRHNLSFVANDAEDRGFTFFQVPDASKVNPDASVTAILCLSGLPRDLAASVLAHEATHAWIKLHPRFDFERPIPPQVEEGCAQLVAHLFLNEGLDAPEPLDNNDGTGPTDEKLRQYFKFSIETDDHEIYGTGYRRAAMAYSKIGIEALMSHIVLYQDFPET